MHDETLMPHDNQHERKRRSTLTGMPLYKLKCYAEVESALVCQRPEKPYSKESL